MSSITFDNYSEWWNSSGMQDLRSDLYNGIHNKNCTHCYETEAQGKESPRLNYNNIFRKYANFIEIKQSAANNFIVDREPVTWDLKLGNLCNLKCVMCVPELSSKIEAEINENKELIGSVFPKKIMFNATALDWSSSGEADKFFEAIKKSVRWLKLQGGEPFAIKKVRDLIQSLDTNQTTLAITTNGTVLDQPLYNGLANMESLEISISIEAAGPANDIIRYGSDWEVIKRNILRLQELPNIDLQINHILQITSVFYLKDVLQFSEEHGLHLNVKSLDYQDELALSACPKEYLLQMLDDLNTVDIKHPKNQYIKNYVNTVVSSTVFNPQHWEDFKKYVALLDQLRPNKYSSILMFKENLK